MLAAQILVMLEDGLWLDNARSANAAAQALAQAVPERLVYPVEANEIFITVTDDEAKRLRAQGFDFNEWGAGQGRFVTSWDSDPAAVAKLASAIAAL
jgi:threonine aldolase